MKPSFVVKLLPSELKHVQKVLATHAKEIVAWAAATQSSIREQDLIMTERALGSLNKATLEE